jgi:hypothetical protein
MTKKRITIPAKIRSIMIVSSSKAAKPIRRTAKIALSCAKIRQSLFSVLAEAHTKRAPDKEYPNYDTYDKEWAHNS